MSQRPCSEPCLRARSSPESLEQFGTTSRRRFSTTGPDEQRSKPWEPSKTLSTRTEPSQIEFTNSQIDDGGMSVDTPVSMRVENITGLIDEFLLSQDRFRQDMCFIEGARVSLSASMAALADFYRDGPDAWLPERSVAVYPEFKDQGGRSLNTTATVNGAVASNPQHIADDAASTAPKRWQVPSLGQDTIRRLKYSEISSSTGCDGNPH